MVQWPSMAPVRHPYHCATLRAITMACATFHQLDTSVCVTWVTWVMVLPALTLMSAKGKIFVLKMKLNVSISQDHLPVSAKKATLLMEPSVLVKHTSFIVIFKLFYMVWLT